MRLLPRLPREAQRVRKRCFSLGKWEGYKREAQEAVHCRIGVLCEKVITVGAVCVREEFWGVV